MDQRQGDPRIYIITIVFLSCIISGGVLLGLYLLQSDPNPLFLQAGMVFVGFPWLFWFMAYLYSCVLKPCTVSVLSRSVANFDPEKGEENKKTPDIVTSSDPMVTTSPSTNSPSPKDGEKHVQFGNVEVLGDQEGEKEEDEGSSNKLIQILMRMDDEAKEKKHRRSHSGSSDDESSFGEDCDRKPLRLPVANN